MAKINRIFFGIVGAIILFCHLAIFNDHLVLGIATFILWGLCLNFGGWSKRTLNLWLLKKKIKKKNSWTHSFLLSSILVLILISILPTLADQLILIYAFSINYAYLGAKLVCALTRCCGIHHALHSKHNFSLQKQEYNLTFSSLTIAAMLYFFSSHSTLLIACGLLLSHAGIRGYAALLRFPYKKKMDFIKDFSISIILLMAIFPLLLILNRFLSFNL